MVAVADRTRGTLGALVKRGSGIDHKALATRQAQVGGVVADASLAFRIRVVGVVFSAAPIQVIRIAIVPSRNGLPAAITNKYDFLGQFALGHNRQVFVVL